VDQRKRRGGRFFGRRVNCEQVPLLPAWAVGWMLNDPRKIPYLLVWKSERDGTVKEAVRVAREVSQFPPFDLTGWIEIKRPGGDCINIRTIERALPRNGGRALLLVCPHCQVARRALCGWQPGGPYTSSVVTAWLWQCRSCAGLRHESEGGALVHRGRGTLAPFEMYGGPLRSPRTEPWYPHVFTSPQQAADAGLCNLAG